MIPALVFTRGSLRQRTDTNSNLSTRGPGGGAKELASLDDACGESLNRTAPPRQIRDGGQARLVRALGSSAVKEPSRLQLHLLAAASNTGS